MRLIGHVENETNAHTFGDYLYVQGIENQIEFTKDQGWGIWVNEEEKLETATNLLVAFRQNPADPKYQAQSKSAADLRNQKAKSEEAWRDRLRSRRHLFQPLTGYGFGPLTFVLIAVSVGVFIFSDFGRNRQAIQSLFITPYMLGDSYFNVDPSLPEIRHGQLWRLFTPMFIHFSTLHILFNMLWLRDLGSMIEARQSTGRLAILVFAIAAGSNLAQFYYRGAPNFGGMSGVVYGLLGYVWLRGKLDPASGLFVHPSTVVMMLIWLVAGFTGILGPIANLAHLAGLLMGAVWGYLSSLRYR
jgi:rhomboid protease GlpG